MNWKLAPEFQTFLNFGGIAKISTPVDFKVVVERFFR